MYISLECSAREIKFKSNPLNCYQLVITMFNCVASAIIRFDRVANGFICLILSRNVLAKLGGRSFSSDVSLNSLSVKSNPTIYNIINFIVINFSNENDSRNFAKQPNTLKLDKMV